MVTAFPAEFMLDPYLRTIVGVGTVPLATTAVEVVLTTYIFALQLIVCSPCF